MSKAIFAVRDAGRLVCDHPACDRVQRYEVKIIGSPVFPRMVCRYHKAWAREDLLERERRFAARPATGGTAGAPDE